MNANAIVCAIIAAYFIFYLGLDALAEIVR